MITKIFTGFTGSGLRKLLVVPEAIKAAGNTRRITVITSHRELAHQFKEMLPNADYCLTSEWLRRANDKASDLVIVDELHPAAISRIRATLESVPAEVWAIGDAWLLAASGCLCQIETIHGGLSHGS